MKQLSERMPTPTDRGRAKHSEKYAYLFLYRALRVSKACLESSLVRLLQFDPNCLALRTPARFPLFAPPGTGKTFLGVLLAQAILSSTSEKILCVCYTNHALDSFLEDMLGKGITDIVRIGGGSKNSRLDPYQLRNRQASGFDRVQNRQFAHLKGALEESQGKIDTAQRASRLNSKPDKMEVVAWLEDEDAEAFRELQMPDGLGGAGDTVVGKKVHKRERQGVIMWYDGAAPCKFVSCPWMYRSMFQRLGKHEHIP